MRLKYLLGYISSFLIIIFISYLSSCDSRTGITEPPPPPPPIPNPYGDGNGKITFYRTQQIQGPVVIKISNSQIIDSIVWQFAPNCDTNLAASIILKKGDYSVRIEGATFLCNYNIKVEERKCKLLDYTGCNGGYVGCYDMTGVWLRTADGPCPNCQGLKVQFSNGVGEVIYTPPGCRFALWDIKWKDFDINNCTIYDLARDQYGGSPEYFFTNITFFNKDSLQLNGPSGIIPYSRISYNVEKKNKNIIKPPEVKHNIPASELQFGQ